MAYVTHRGSLDYISDTIASSRLYVMYICAHICVWISCYMHILRQIYQMYQYFVMGVVSLSHGNHSPCIISRGPFAL